MTPMKVGIMLGRLSSGLQSDHGQVYHAVTRRKTKRPPCPFNDFGKKIIENDDYETDVSLCGKKPGRRSVGWSFEAQAVVTCDKCLKRLNSGRRLSKLKAQAIVAEAGTEEDGFAAMAKNVSDRS